MAHNFLHNAFYFISGAVFLFVLYAICGIEKDYYHKDDEYCEPPEAYKDYDDKK